MEGKKRRLDISQPKPGTSQNRDELFPVPTEVFDVPGPSI
ncbi:hypothetical protein Bhyg_17324, partial [Pseudolycoriella hygida]